MPENEDAELTPVPDPDAQAQADEDRAPDQDAEAVPGRNADGLELSTEDT